MTWTQVGELVLVLLGLYLLLGIILRFTGGYAPGWQVRCATCSRTRKAADAGVVRIGKSAGKVSGMVGWCPDCRGVRFLVVERSSDENTPPAADGGR